MANSPILGSAFSPISWTGDACEQFSQLFQVSERLNTIFSWLLNASGALSDDVLDGIESRVGLVGSIQMYSSDVMPSDNWLPCDGRSVNRATYAKLFDRMGTKYGSVDSDSFNLPTSADLFPRGAGGALAIGEIGGADSVTLAPANVPGHYHGVAVSAGNDNLNLTARPWVNGANGTTATVSISGDDAENTGTDPITAGDIATTTAIQDTAVAATPVTIIPRSIGHLFIVKVK